MDRRSDVVLLWMSLQSIVRVVASQATPPRCGDDQVYIASASTPRYSFEIVTDMQRVDVLTWIGRSFGGPARNNVGFLDSRRLAHGLYATWACVRGLGRQVTSLTVVSGGAPLQSRHDA